MGSSKMKNTVENGRRALTYVEGVFEDQLVDVRLEVEGDLSTIVISGELGTMVRLAGLYEAAKS